MPNEVTNVIKLFGGPTQIRQLSIEIQNETYGPGSISFQKLIPMPEEFCKANAALESSVQHDKNARYNWSIRNWGTKKDAYGFMRFEAERKNEKIMFLTAWSPPHLVIQNLSERYPDVFISHIWASDNLGCDCSMRQYYNGQNFSGIIL